jgi:transcriptional antiterminator NusG
LQNINVNIKVTEETAHQNQTEQPHSIQSPYDRPGFWYVVHTYAGFEEKAKSNLEMAIANRDAQDLIHEIVIPKEKVTEFKKNKPVKVDKKIFPGYLLIRCEKDPRAFDIIRTTPGITGFVGASARPTALSRKEVEEILVAKTEGELRSKPKIDFELGETVRVKEGPFADFSGQIAEINEDQLKVKVLVNIFGRETPVELEFTQIAKL